MAEKNSRTEDKNQPLIEHLIELRSRILYSIISVLIVFLPLFYFANDLYRYISEPLRVFLPEDSSMIATEVASPFLTPFKLSLVLALFMAMPYILHQVWSFIAPGLYKKEKRLALPILCKHSIILYRYCVFLFRSLSARFWFLY